MKKMKKWIDVVAFLLVSISIFYIINPIFIPQEDIRQEKKAFYQQPEKTIDVVYIGSSSMLRAITPMEIWRDYGITGYSMATTVQAPVVTLGYLKDVFKTQHPQVVVLGCEWLFDDYDYVQAEADLRFALDCIPNSLTKMKVIQTIVQHDPSQSFLSYLFPIFRYHSRWTEIETFSYVKNRKSIQMGYIGLGQSSARTIPENHLASSGTSPSFSEESLQFYREAVELCKQNGAQVLLVKFPRMAWSAEESKAQQDFANEMEIPFLDFNQSRYWNAISLDPKNDFYDDSHLSSTGASKLSLFLGQYLRQNYQIVDKRADPDFTSWNDNLTKYREEFSFCLHENNNGLDAFYEMEIATDYMKSNDLREDDFTYTWTMYRDGKQIEQREYSNSNRFPLQFDGSGRYTAKCEVYQNNELVCTISSLGYQI